MKRNPFNPQKQSGKVVVSLKPIGNATPTATKHKDTDYYQVNNHGDYVQERN